ncbi:MAG: response regulator transcription factor [Anaerolineae bacterium]|nr:response regulator transcription factor [Anaerolineae bacterium]
MNDLRLLIIGDDPLARAGLASLLKTQPGCEVVGQVSADSDLVNAVSIYQPQVILWDWGWDSAALDRLLEVRDALPPVVALLRDVSAAADAWSAGARGLLRRDASTDTLIAALEAVQRGLVALDPQMAAAVMPARERPITPPVDDLTPREQEVLQLMAEGLPNKIIAQRLSISEHTVKFHINAILSKLNAQSRTDAVVRATRSGLIML